MLKAINKGIQIYKDIRARSNIIEREGPFIDRDNIEQRVKEERLKIKDPEVKPFQNDALAFGIAKKNLNLFGYNTPKELFYSTHNIDVPDLMLMNLNEAEILAIYLGSYKIKMDKHRHKELFNGSFEDIIKSIDKEGYSYLLIRHLQHTGFNPHSTKRGDKQKRLELMPPSVRREFMHLFLNSRKKPLVDFYDPNCDGHSKWVYIDSIYKYLKARSISNKYNSSKYLNLIID